MARKKKIEPAADAAPPDERRLIYTSRIDPNPWNGHRKADEDLIASIREHGILQNLVVRPVKNFRFEVISGSRRLDAAFTIGLEQAPCLVRDLDDHAAREVTIIENLQREDLHPVDEAKAIAMLISDGHSKEEVAARIGKSVAFVTRRAKLAGLAPKIIEDAGEDIRRMSLRVLELLATLPEAKQADVFEGLGGIYIEADELSRQIERDSHAIAGAPFDCADETLVPEAGACAVCPKRTGAEPLLFEDLGGEIGSGDCCLDQFCYARKLNAAMARLEAKAREKHGDKLLLVADRIPYGEDGTALRKRGARELAPSWQDIGLKRCKKSEKGAMPAFIVHGKGEGATTWVRDIKKVPTLAPDAEGESPEVPADPMAVKRAKLDQRRHAWIAAKLRDLVGGEDNEGNRRLPAEKYCNPEQMVRIAAAFGGSSIMGLHPGEDCSCHGDEFGFWAQSAGVPVSNLYCHVWDAAAGALRRGMQVNKVSDIDHDFVDGLKTVTDLLGLSWNTLWSEACEAIPDPKAWSKGGAA